MDVVVRQVPEKVEKSDVWWIVVDVFS